MRWLIVIFLFALAPTLKAQVNLVPNGSFEEFTSCPTSSAQLSRCIGWISPTPGSPDYYNACGSGSSVPQNGTGYQEAHSGNAYTGAFAHGGPNEQNAREYIQIELSESITAGVPYIVSFWVSLADQLRISVNTWGAHFSQEQISGNMYDVLDYVPQILNTSDNPLTDKVNWMLVTDTFISNTGGERFITIGNFNEDGESDTLTVSSEDGQQNKSYYLIDDVSVLQLTDCADTTYVPLITSLGPLTVCYGDTIMLDAESGYDQYLWSTGETTQSISVSDSGDYFVSVLVDTCWFVSDTLEISSSNPIPFVSETCAELICFGGFVSYQWYLNDDPITVNGTYQICNSQQSGTYYVIVSDEYGCIGQSSIIEHSGNCGGVDDITETAINIYPNPATSSITIKFPASPTFKNAELSILTITGQVINELIIDNEKLTINTEHFSKGVYFFKVETGDEVVVKKVIVK
jgi:hypothetical protein